MSESEITMCHISTCLRYVINSKIYPNVHLVVWRMADHKGSAVATGSLEARHFPGTRWKNGGLNDPIRISNEIRIFLSLVLDASTLREICQGQGESTRRSSCTLDRFSHRVLFCVYEGKGDSPVVFAHKRGKFPFCGTITLCRGWRTVFLFQIIRSRFIGILTLLG